MAIEVRRSDGVLLTIQPEWKQGCRDALKGLPAAEAHNGAPSPYLDEYEFAGQYLALKEVEGGLKR